MVNTHSQKVVCPTQPGKKHDKKVTDEAAIRYPLNATLGKDTGFQGYEPLGVLTWQPKKKPKGQALSVADQCLNQTLSAGRIIIEPSLSGVKRCRIVKDVLRNTKAGFSDLVMEVACALHNLRVAFRHPVPSLDILAMSAYSE